MHAPPHALRAVRIEGLLDEDVISKRTNTHRCLKELRKKGAVADALAADACVKSQFGDPLATGAEDAIKINNVLAQAITETDAPEYDGVNATQSWRLKRGPLRLEGLTRVSFDSDGRASIIELGVSNVNGLEVDATSAQASRPSSVFGRRLLRALQRRRGLRAAGFGDDAGARLDRLDDR